jgi:nitroimidazol reductase NimA-like FMN-containing flavoprotein (pyridoxamine 5'-phosphate oxidase superfamily)
MSDTTGGPSDTVPVDAVPMTDRTRLRRLPEQGSYARSDLHAVLDAGFVCHLGLVVDDWPMVVPTTYARDGDTVIIHGSVASRSLRAGARSVPACVTVTHIDGLVLARSVFEHAVNYRCAILYGELRAVVDPDEKLAGLRALSERVAPGQWGYARTPSDKELKATTVLRMALDECSVKIRRGPPDDGDGPDAGSGVWAGEIPLRTVRLDPVADPALEDGMDLPAHLVGRGPAPGSVPWRDIDGS